MNETARKVINISVKVLTWMLIAFTVFMMVFTIFTVSTFDKNERSVFGTRFYIVKSDSMSLSDKNADLDVHFDAGDIVLIKELDAEGIAALEAGDIIAFLSTNPDSYGETVTHMIKEVRTDSSGKLIGYVTFGTNTGASDEKVVEPEYVLGQYTGKLVGVGNFFAFVKSTPGYIVCILIPFLLLIAYNGINVIRLFRKYKQEQTAAMEAERAEIEEERRRNEQMLLELRRLQEQLTGQVAGASERTAEPAAAPAPEAAPAPTEPTEADAPAADAAENN